MTQSGPDGADDLPAEGVAPDDTTAPAVPAVPDTPSAAPGVPVQPVMPPAGPQATYAPPGGGHGQGVPAGHPGLPPVAPQYPPPVRPAPALGAQRALAGALLAVIGVAAGVIVTLLVVKGDSGAPPAAAPTPTVTASVAEPSSTPEAGGDLVEPRNTTAGGIVLGNPQARVQLRVYEDYLCPYCAEFEKENGAQLQQWIDAGDVSADFRMLAILDGATSTAYSSRAAMASAAVRDLAPDKWLAFHAGLFANQPPERSAGLTDQTLADLAGQAGAPQADVLAALTSRRYAPWVDAVTRTASQGGDKVEGTPTVVLIDTKAKKGYLVQDWSAASLKKTVEQLLGQSAS